MNPSIRLLLAALLLVPPGVCQGVDPSPSQDDQSVAAAQSVSGGVDQSLHGVVGNLTAGKISEIYGERQLGDPNAVAGGPSGTGATSNAAANLPDAQLPQGFKRDAAAPPVLAAAGPAAAPAPVGMWGKIRNWFSPVATPPAKPVPDPSFSREVPCANGQPGCVEVMSVKENSPAGFKSIPLTDFVDYGTLQRDGKPDTQIWDSRPWWKFWTDPRQVSTDDIRQGGLGDCSLLASLAAIANKEPQVLRAMIKQQKGTLAVWVQFFDGEPAKPVMVGPVDEKFPVYKAGVTNGTGGPSISGQAVFSAPAGKQGAIWPLLIEKAYAIKFNKDSFAELNQGVWPQDAMTHITGRPSQRLVVEPDDSNYKGPVAFQDLVTWDANSQPITMSTKSGPKDGCPPDPGGKSASSAKDLKDGLQFKEKSPIVVPPPETTDSVCTDPLYAGPAACLPGSKDPVCADPGKIVRLETTHAYWVKSVDASAQTVTLANPWGSNQPTVTLPWTRLQKSLYYVYVNDKSP